MNDLDDLDKASVLGALRDQIERDLAAATDSQQRTQSGATHEESRPENEKDTRALESSYLARGQAQRVLELRAALTTVSQLQLRRFDETTAVAVTALLQLDDGDRRLLCFMSPVGGGLELGVGAATVRVVTPQSPLGRALLGKHQGDDVEVSTPQGVREYSLVALA